MSIALPARCAHVTSGSKSGVSYKTRWLSVTPDEKCTAGVTSHHEYTLWTSPIFDRKCDYGHFRSVKSTLNWLTYTQRCRYVDVKNWNLLAQLQIAQSAGTVEYTDCYSAEKYPPLMSVLIMTLNNLMVRLQWFWRFGKCEAPIYCHSNVHCGPEW